MDFERMNPIQRRLHNAACVLGADGDEYGFEQLQRDAIAELERLRIALDEERQKMAAAVRAMGLAAQWIHAADEGHSASMPRLAEAFAAEAGKALAGAGVLAVTPAGMRQAVAECEIQHSGDWCETCPTVDACRIRGACSLFLGKPHGA